MKFRKLRYWDFVFVAGLIFAIGGIPLVFLSHNIEPISMKLLILLGGSVFALMGLLTMFVSIGFERIEKKLDKGTE